jgi:glucosamine--fructose-6-phosphate aminotransferase (isomerizing)
VSGSEEGSTDGRAIAAMREEVEAIPVVIEDHVRTLREPIAVLLAELGSTRGEVVLTGCGDSYFAGLAVRLAFDRIAGVRCRVVEALELARYEVRYVPGEPPPVLVAVSYSGEVGRTIEAAAVGDRFGWRTIALTGVADGRLARTTRHRILMDVPTRGLSPGTSTYVAAVTALLVLVAELARANGRAAEAAALDATLADAPRLARETLERAEAPARDAARTIAAAPVTTYLGAGPSRAAAGFGAAKLIEGAQRYGVAQDLEEWAHEQFFVSGPGTPVVLVAPSGPSYGRALELLDEMNAIGAPAFLVSDVAPPAAAQTAGHLPISEGMDEAASGLLTCLPLAQLGLHVSEILGTSAYGFISPEHEREHYETIHRVATAEPA